MVNGTWKRGHHRRGMRPGTFGTPPVVSDAVRRPSTPKREDGGPPSDEGDPPEWFDVRNATVDGGGGVESLIGMVPDDPDPSWMDRLAAMPVSGPVEITKQVKEDIAAMIGVASLIPADLLAATDPYCAGAYAQALPQIIDAAVPIICRSQRVLQFMLGKQGFIEWVRLAAAFKPVIVAVWAHHIVHTVELVDGNAVYDDFSAYRAVA